MRNLSMKKLVIVLVSVLTAVVACDRSSAPPAPLPIEQLPAALQKAFLKAKPEAKELVTQVLSALQSQDYSKAYLDLQTLAAKPGLNREQQSVASRAVVTANGLLQEAQTKGDKEAAQTLK